MPKGSSRNAEEAGSEENGAVREALSGSVSQPSDTESDGEGGVCGHAEA